MEKKLMIFTIVTLIVASLACSFGGYTISSETQDDKPPTQSSDTAPSETTSSGEPTPTAIVLEAKPTEPVQVVVPTPALNLQIPQPDSGTGSVAGRLLWNGQPVVGNEVKLCEKMGFISGCEGKQFSTKTDENGIYLLANVTPGEYALVFHAIDHNSWLYVTSLAINARKFKIEADKTVVLDDQHLYKLDLKQVSPTEKQKISEPNPTLQWEPYPGAAYYEVRLSPEGALASILRLDNYTDTQVKVEQPLLACDYYWRVEAFNTQGVKIADHDGYSHFTVIDQAVSCYIKIISPSDKAQVPLSGLKLSWEAHPQASYYKLVVWKGEVGGEKTVDYARVDGTDFSFTTDLTPGEYIWSLMAYNASGDAIASSTLYHFFIK